MNASTNRGKTSQTTTAGSFAPKAGRPSRVTLDADSDADAPEIRNVWVDERQAALDARLTHQVDVLNRRRLLLAIDHRLPGGVARCVNCGRFASETAPAHDCPYQALVKGGYSPAKAKELAHAGFDGIHESKLWGASIEEMGATTAGMYHALGYTPIDATRLHRSGHNIRGEYQTEAVRVAATHTVYTRLQRDLDAYNRQIAAGFNDKRTRQAVADTTAALNDPDGIAHTVANEMRHRSAAAATTVDVAAFIAAHSTPPRNRPGAGWTANTAARLQPYVGGDRNPAMYQNGPAGTYDNGDTGVLAFNGITGADANSLLKSIPRDQRDDRHHDSPTAAQLLRAAAADPDIEAGGYLIPPDRADERISIDRITTYSADHGDHDQTRAWLRAKFGTAAGRTAQVIPTYDNSGRTGWSCYWD